MALSKRTKEIMVVAMADKKSAEELSKAIDTGFNATPAADVANFGATTNIPASAASLSTGNTYTDAAVATAINGAVDGVTATIETRLDNIESKINAILTALKNANLML